MSLTDFGLQPEYTTEQPNRKALEREHITKETEQFLARGGTIQQLRLGESKWEGLHIKRVYSKMGRRYVLTLKDKQGRTVSYLDDLMEGSEASEG